MFDVIKEILISEKEFTETNAQRLILKRVGGQFDLAFFVDLILS